MALSYLGNSFGTSQGCLKYIGVDTPLLGQGWQSHSILRGQLSKEVVLARMIREVVFVPERLSEVESTNGWTVQLNVAVV